MDNLNDLRQIWLTANTGGLPDPGEVKRAAKKFRNQKLRNKLLIIAMAIGCIAAMIATLLLHGPQMLTTQLAAAFTIVAASVLIFTNLRSIGRFYHFKDYDNKQFIEFLEQTRLNQLYFYKKTQVLGLTFSSASALLFLFELFYKHRLFGTIAYMVMILFLLANWFIFRPRAFKKQEIKMNDLLRALKKIADQL